MIPDGEKPGIFSNIVSEIKTIFKNQFNFDNQRIKKYRCIIQKTIWPKLWRPFLPDSKLLSFLPQGLGRIYISDAIS